MSNVKLKLIQGDCMDVLPKLKDKSIDLILTDVPYNLVGHTSGLIKFKDREDMGKANIVEWNKPFDSTSWLPQAKRILKDKGNLFIFCSHRDFGDYFKWLDKRFERVFFGVWHKTNPVPQVRKVSFLSSLELFLCAWNKGHKWNFKTQNEMHNFIETPICMGNERTLHEAQIPVKLMKHFIEIASNPNDLVLDPFVGSGTTMKACLELKRGCVGIEINPEYIKITKKRLNWGSNLNPNIEWTLQKE